MTIQALKKKKQELLASQVSNLVSDTNENLLRVNLSKFFTDLEQDIQSALMEYWNDTVLLQGQLNLILSPIHEKHQEYYELIMKHKLQEFNRGKRTGERLVRRQTENALKSSKPVKFQHSPKELFGTLQYSEDKLSKDTFTASEFTLNRIDESINQILLDGYREGNGINDVSRKLTERFDQLRTWEATRIARTEIHTAQNMGVMNSYESLGVEYTQWKSAHDKRVRGNRKSDRANHIIMDGEIIPFGGTYSNGLRYPGDKSGKIEEWINCRCSNAPYVMPQGMMAPPGMSNFKESDLVSIGTQPIQTEPQPIEEPTVNSRIAELEKEIEEVQAIADKWKSRGKDSLAQTFQDQADGLRVELDKLRKPKVKVVSDSPKPDVDIDGILSDVLDEFGLTDKKKPKSKPKKKKSKQKQPKKEKVTIRTVTEQLRAELPSEFSDEAIDYIANRVKKRGTVKSEYGQIFDYKTGKTHSPEFRGGKHSVNIKTEDWIKPVNQMTMEEQIDALKNPQKYKKSFVDKSNTLATQHNHPASGSHAPSGADFYTLLVHDWETYGLQISEHEVWCIERKGSINMFDAKEVEKKCNRLFSTAKRRATKRLQKDFDGLEGRDRINKHMELINEEYGNELLKYFKSQPHGIKLTQVKI